MLAQLDKVQGVQASRVDWTGRYILLALDAQADEARVAADATAALGSGARRLDAAAEAEQVAAYRRGEPWMRAGETLKLSGEEARVLGERFGRRIAQELGLDEAQTQRLVTLVQEGAKEAFEKVHQREGEVDKRLHEAWLPIAERIASRSAEFLTPDQASRIRDLLRRPFAAQR